MRARSGALIFAVLALSTTARAQSARDSIVVHLDGDDDAVVQENVDDRWVTICAAPCNRSLDAQGTFRVNGSGLRASPSFRLHAETGATENLYVDSAPSGAYALGAGLTVLGALGVATGLVLSFFGAEMTECVTDAGIPSNGQNDPSNCKKTEPELVGDGIAISVVSGVAMLAGIALLVADYRSTVSQSASRTRDRSVAVQWFAPPIRDRALSTRSPITRELPSGSTSPIFTLSF